MRVSVIVSVGLRREVRSLTESSPLVCYTEAEHAGFHGVEMGALGGIGLGFGAAFVEIFDVVVVAAKDVQAVDHKLP